MPNLDRVPFDPKLFFLGLGPPFLGLGSSLLGFRVCLLGFRVCLLGFRVCLLGFRVCLLGFRVCLLGFRVCLLGFRVKFLNLLGLTNVVLAINFSLWALGFWCQIWTGSLLTLNSFSWV